MLSELGGLPGDSWELDVVGSMGVEPAYSAALREQVRQMGAEQCVRFHGALSDGETAARLQASQVLVVPSSYEGFGIVYLEGMGFGLPAIGSSTGAAGEIITDAQTGFLIRPGDAASLAACLQTLAGDRTLLQRMSLQALERYRRQPAWVESAESIRQFLIGMVNNFPKS